MGSRDLMDLIIGLAMGCVICLFGVIAGSAWTITHYTAEERKKRPQKGPCSHVSLTGYNQDRQTPCGCQQYIGPSVPEVAA